MTVYFEYVLIENFCLDFALLALAFSFCKTKITWWKMVISGGVGGVFALLYPLLILPEFLLIFLKIAVGFLLCFISFPRIKNRKDAGKYLLNAGVFFALTFLYGGALTALFSAIFPKKVPAFLVVIGFAFLSLFSLLLIKKLYQKRALFQHIYRCEIFYNQKTAQVLGYQDSGNLASKNGLPVCFLSPDVFYVLWGEEFLCEQIKKTEKCTGQVCDEMVISTMSGEKKVRLYKGDLEVCVSSQKRIRAQVYFVPSTNMINREYKLLLNAGIIKDERI